MRKVAPFLLAACFLTSCSHMSKQECQLADWRAIGLEDGTRGLSSTQLARHRKACAKAGVTPNLSAYQAGHLEGLKSYCTTSNGYQFARRGGTYNGLCRGVNEAAFLRGYEPGRLLFSAYRDLQQARSKLEHGIQHLEDIEHDIEHEQALIISSESTAEDRALALLNIKKLNDSKEALVADLPLLEEAVAHYELEYNNIRRIHENQGFY